MFNRLKNIISGPDRSSHVDDTGRSSIKQDASTVSEKQSVPVKEQGDAHLREGNLDEAIKYYRHAISLNPNFAKAHSNLGFALREQGNYEGAERSLATALSIDSKISDAHYMLGTIYQSQGRMKEATDLFYMALELDPDHEFAYRDLCYVLFQQGKIEDAKTVISKGITRYPDMADYHYYLGNIFTHTKEFEKAAACYKTALSIQPAYAEVHFNLGILLQEQGMQSEAISCFREATRIKPDFIDALGKLGITLQNVGQLKEAEACYRKALQIKPDFAEVLNNLGNVLKEMGRSSEAESCYRRALQLKPDFADAYCNLGAAQHDSGLLTEALTCFQKALKLNPGFAEAHCNLGNTLRDLGRLEEAEACYQKALQLKPASADTFCNLGVTLQNMGKLAEAEDCFRRALEIKPDHADTFRNLGVTLRNMGRLSEAEECYRKALKINPAFADAYSNLLFLYSYHALDNPVGYLALARGWEQACVPGQERQAARQRAFKNPPLANRRLKVGYVSGDFRQHAVSFFMEQLFARHDRNTIELFAYSNNGVQDAVTERLQKHAEHWVQITGIGDGEARSRIEADGIDVLIDLSGHTARNRLGVFARRAAPVQAYYLGYFASTGLSEMDYWIGDDILTPPETDSHFSEQVWRLPRTAWSYDGKDAPTQEWRPAPDNTVWLGSFNQLNKLTQTTLALWSHILQSLPEGKLLLKTRELDDITNRQRILDALNSYGISKDRIVLQGSVTPSWREHMAYYDRLDIVLDPVGAMGGVTTTCDALWMGAPVITLKGEHVTSRATSSLLSAIGHSDWLVHSEAEYLNKVVTLAREKELRKTLRSCQREQMARSPLCDARDLAKNLEHAYAEMFHRWLCNNK